MQAMQAMQAVFSSTWDIRPSGMFLQGYDKDGTFPPYSPAVFGGIWSHWRKTRVAVQGAVPGHFSRNTGLEEAVGSKGITVYSWTASQNGSGTGVWHRG